jgi:hypothetical protein
MTQDEIIEMANKASKEWLKEFPSPEETANQVPKRFLEIFAKLVAAKAIAELESQEPLAWDLADKVRQDLDRQSCPDAFMRIAVESIVKHHPAQPAPVQPLEKSMRVERAAFFMRRFKSEEKLLGPNEQAALDFVIEMLTCQAQRTEQEPVGEFGWAANIPNTIGEVHWKNGSPPIGTKLYTHPPQRTWVGLTDEELADCLDMSIQKTCCAIEAKLKEKNT